MTFLRISIFTTIERNEAIALVRQAIGANGGWVVDHALLSNLATTINFEVSAAKAKSLVVALRDAGFKPDVDRRNTGATPADVPGQVSLSFIHREPDLRRDVPPFG